MNECEVYEPIGGLPKDYQWPPVGKFNKWLFHNSPNPLDAWRYRYTRSRDALKAIRPEGWSPIGYGYDKEIGHFAGGWSYSLYKVTPDFKLRTTVNIANQKSEELAELHAIIQAVEYERKNIGKTGSAISMKTA